MHRPDHISQLLDRRVLRASQITLEQALYLLLGILAVAACLSNLGARGQSHDECVHFYFSYDLYEGDGFVYQPWRHGPFLYYVNALAYWLFGVSDLTSRLGPAAFGVALVLLPALLRKQLGRVGALATSAMTLISPSTLYYARYLRNDIYMMVWALLMAIALFQFLRTRRAVWLYLGAASTVLSLATKETSFITGYIGFSFVAALALRRWLRPKGLRRAPIVGGTLLLLLVLAAIGASFYAGTLPELEAGAEVDEQAPGLGRKQVEPILEIVLLIAGLIALWLINWALLALCRDAFSEGREALSGLRLTVAYLAAIGSLLALCAIPAGLLWWAGSRLHETEAPYWLAELVGFVGLCVGAGAGGTLWWRLVGAREQDAQNDRMGRDALVGAGEQDAQNDRMAQDGRLRRWRKKVRGWLPQAFSLRTMWIAVAVAVGLFVLLYTTFFTHPRGVVTGAVGGLQYWLTQQEVKRASQPWYYYGILVGLYEFLPLGLSVLALAYLVRRRRASLFVAYLVYWTFSAWLIYSWAGEKMPWMVVHIVQPMLLLGGWMVNELWQKVKRVNVRAGAFALLLVAATFTVRYSWLANYINYDTAREFIVYSHGTPDLKLTVRELQALSRRLYDDETALPFAYSDDASWPFECYFETAFPKRTFIGTKPTRANTNAPVLLIGAKEIEAAEPFLGERYYRFDRKYLWFPHQDYYMNLSLAIPPEEKRAPGVNYFFLDMLDPDKRRAFLDIVLYRRYEQSLADWEPSNPGKFALYLRKDLVNQIWTYQAGPSEEP